MLEGKAMHVETGGPSGAVMVGSGGGVNVSPTVTAVVLAAGVLGGMFAVVAVLICCRYCCAVTRRPATTSMLKRFVNISS